MTLIFTSIEVVCISNAEFGSVGNKMKKNSLSIAKPFYSVSHSQGTTGAILYNNPSMRNWYLNNSLVLQARADALGSAQPKLCMDICQSNIEDNPNIDRQQLLMTFLDGCVSRVIRNMIDRGWYVYFGGVDDYYMKGRAGYHTRHYLHDGLICGYDSEKNTYSIFVYDEHMRYSLFEMPQRCFDRARKSSEQMGCCGMFVAVRVQPIQIALEPMLMLEKLRDHLSPPSAWNYDERGVTVYGIETHECAIHYIKSVAVLEGERNIDIRPFKMLLEHKRFMLERLEALERYYKLEANYSIRYKKVTAAAEKTWNRCLHYAMTSNDSDLSEMIGKIRIMRDLEREILSDAVDMISAQE